MDASRSNALFLFWVLAALVFLLMFGGKPLPRIDSDHVQQFRVESKNSPDTVQADGAY